MRHYNDTEANSDDEDSIIYEQNMLSDIRQKIFQDDEADDEDDTCCDCGRNVRNCICWKT